MTTPAIIASLTVAGSLALGASQQSLTTQQSLTEPHEQGSDAPHNSEPRALRQQLREECPPEPWFHPALREFLPSCSGVNFPPEPDYFPLAVLPLSPADVNGDGKAETFRAVDTTLASGSPIVPSDPSPLVAMGGVRVTSAGATPFLIGVAQINTPEIEALIAELPDLGVPYGACFGHGWRISATPKGWIDADEDGDLDLVLWLQVTKIQRRPNTKVPWMGCYDEQQPYSQKPVWLENTGYEQPNPPLTGDVTGDGAVDGADLAVVLGNWTASE